MQWKVLLVYVEGRFTLFAVLLIAVFHYLFIAIFLYFAKKLKQAV